MSGARQVAITGVGVVAPGGVGRKEFWTLLTDGRTATRRLSLFDPTQFRSQVAAECDFDPRAAGLSAREVARNDRFVQFALAAALEAVEDSGLDLRRGDDTAPETSGDEPRGDGGGDGPVVGVCLGSAVGATTRLENEYVVVSDSGRLWEVDPHYASSFLYHALVPSCLATELAHRFGAHGPASVVSTGCTSGIDAVGYGAQLIVDGEADIVLAGASDAPISPISVACFDAIRATSARNDDPEHASRPFDATRDGFVMGEGSAVLVLEDAAAARARGAHIYALVAGYASRSNAFHMTGLRPDGVEMAEAIRVAMDTARVGAHDVNYINAHGSGTKQNDRHETAAFKRSLGERAYEVPVSSIKSMIGHSLGAIGSLEIAACALAIENDVVPPTASWSTRDPECDLDYVPNTARDHTVDVAVSVGSGFGGFQSAIVLTGPDR
ncbi:beta-ketoacyl-[acyl-carrier-protein] synthase family protein [Frankia sp. AgPm24]|uniref:beta-ketoacyl-[acyl-carrier-protein] synthase family protein n=1 Tax=Frankia sp. AgPm24 TaxID=631128 RepID=UPI00200ECC5A|nr:beta-ketoacyl-[acyl-carrier-protein] synthase family protein [Frankia sp. AgPm24]MCK9923899.1 beta-ketoacyl-[acyl-carrier-protein] synthase family protein [Frankia sp. AgPm24]